MVEKGTLISLATVLVEIPAASRPITHSLLTSDICDSVFSYKSAHFIVAFCPQNKVHLCIGHAF